MEDPILGGGGWKSLGGLDVVFARIPLRTTRMSHTRSSCGNMSIEQLIDMFIATSFGTI